MWKVGSVGFRDGHWPVKRRFFYDIRKISLACALRFNEKKIIYVGSGSKGHTRSQHKTSGEYRESFVFFGRGGRFGLIEYSYATHI